MVLYLNPYIVLTKITLMHTYIYIYIYILYIYIYIYIYIYNLYIKYVKLVVNSHWLKNRWILCRRATSRLGSTHEKLCNGNWLLLISLTNVCIYIITSDLLHKSIQFAKEVATVSDNEIHIILQSSKMYKGVVMKILMYPWYATMEQMSVS